MPRELRRLDKKEVEQNVEQKGCYEDFPLTHREYRKDKYFNLDQTGQNPLEISGLPDTVPHHDQTTFQSFMDGPARYLPSIEGIYDPKDDPVHLSREEALFRCYSKAKSQNKEYFGLQNNGYCMATDANSFEALAAGPMKQVDEKQCRLCNKICGDGMKPCGSGCIETEEECHHTIHTTCAESDRHKQAQGPDKGGAWTNMIYHVKGFKRVVEDPSRDSPAALQKARRKSIDVDARYRYEAPVIGKKMDCGEAPDGLFDLSKSQQFQINMFNPDMVVPGSLSVMSAGSGKTCVALNILENFWAADYQTFWITSKELKSIPSRDLYDSICTGKLRDLVNDDSVPLTDGSGNTVHATTRAEKIEFIRKNKNAPQILKRYGIKFIKQRCLSYREFFEVLLNTTLGDHKGKPIPPSFTNAEERKRFEEEVKAMEESEEPENRPAKKPKKAPKKRRYDSDDDEEEEEEEKVVRKPRRGPKPVVNEELLVPPPPLAPARQIDFANRPVKARRSAAAEVYEEDEEEKKYARLNPTQLRAKLRNEQMINENQDFGYKTLFIIDEAHNLLKDPFLWQPIPDSFSISGKTFRTVADVYGSNIEKNRQLCVRDVLAAMLYTSYEKSGPLGARTLLLTATPMDKSPLDMLWLLNLLQDDYRVRLPMEIGNFYDDRTKSLTQDGISRFAKAAHGKITYLNLTQDPTHFARKVFANNVILPMYPFHYKTLRDHDGLSNRELVQRYYERGLIAQTKGAVFSDGQLPNLRLTNAGSVANTNEIAKFYREKLNEARKVFFADRNGNLRKVAKIRKQYTKAQTEFLSFVEPDAFTKKKLATLDRE